MTAQGPAGSTSLVPGRWDQRPYGDGTKVRDLRAGEGPGERLPGPVVVACVLRQPSSPAAFLMFAAKALTSL